MTHTDETAAALLAGILEHPEDDLRRLVYADRLEEIGDAERAEFIRLQCELATLEAAQGTPDFWSAMRMRHIDCNGCSDWCRLRKRERDLLIECGPRWYEEFGRSITGGTECATWSIEGVQPHGWMVFGGGWAVLGGGWAVQQEPFHKGFVGHITGTLAWLIGSECGRCEGTGDVYVDLVGASGLHDDGRRACPACDGTGRTPGHLRELVRQQPITRVTVVDREPWDFGDGEFGWHAEGGSAVTNTSSLPPVVCRAMGGMIFGRRYPTREAAMLALSDALLAWAKRPEVK